MPAVTRDRYDALVFDLDGTLLDGKARLTDRTKAAVARVRALGYQVVLATGRSLGGTKPVHEELGLDTAICCYNGAWIGPRDGGEVWHYAPIPDGLVVPVRSVEARARFLFRHHREHKWTGPIGSPEHRRIAAWYTNVLEAHPSEHPQTDLLRVSMFFDGHSATDEAWGTLPPEARETLHREVFPMSIFPEFEDVSLVLCEVQRRGRGKAEVFRWLSEAHGIDPARVVAVGDQANDVTLLDGAGFAVSMGNGVPAVQALADLVIGDHREEGVARFLEDEVAA